MTGVLFNNFPIFFFLLFGILEIFFFQYYTKYTFSSVKTLKGNITATLANVIASNTQTTFIMFWHVISYLFFKVTNLEYVDIFTFYSIITIIFFIFYFFLGIVTKNFFKKFNGSYQPICFTLISLVYCLGLAYDYISFLLIVETITTLYFFFFLKYSYSNLLSVIKYKNLISYYLWLSFFTLLFIVLNTLLWVFKFGILDFVELSFFLKDSTYIVFILIGFFWKLGVPGFHFFKLELYKYLEILPLIIFSTISLVVNTLLFTYLLYIFSIVVSFKLLIFFLVISLNLILLVQGLDKIYFFYFFALSSISTWAFFFLISIA